jgi:hypothetical protein
MEHFISSCLKGIRLGLVQRFDNMSVFPLLSTDGEGPEYITLDEALGKGTFKVTEVSESGTVPLLRASNEGETSVLLVDGEELAGAKQNRILNTAILVRAGQEVTIPVSCTEHGRWSYTSKRFFASGNVMTHDLRSSNMYYVHSNLMRLHKYESNQAAVWSDIATMAADAKVRSATGAMKDIHAALSDDVAQSAQHFELIDSQKGILAFIDDEPSGMDFISREAAFRLLFPKFIRSLALEAFLRKERMRHRTKTEPEERAYRTPEEHDAAAFVERAIASREEKYPSVGLGWSYRFTGANTIGSALAVDDAVVHTAFFQMMEVQ